MGTFKPTNSDFTIIEKDGEKIQLINKEKFNSFNEDILGLGKIQRKSKQTSALSVIFDLEGFTNFCRQIDPQLAMPEYLSEFLNWIFNQIRMETTNEEFDEGYRTYCSLPFLSKFLGDGILFLWDVENIADLEILNIIASMQEICEKYESDFLPKISKKISTPPLKLRCGIARGAIYSVGDGNDFVGPCINMSARLQKLNSLSFCFSRRGLDPNLFAKTRQKDFLTKKVDILGIGGDELVCILKKELDKLGAVDKAKFKNI